MPVQIQMRRGTTSEWSTANPTLASGEVGVDTTLTKFKVGNGSTAWNSLGYASLTFQGAYAGGTTYYPNDIVGYNGSSYICILQSTGNLPTNATYWSVLAQAGSGDVTGPASSTDNVLAVFDGTTGNSPAIAGNTKYDDDTGLLTSNITPATNGTTDTFVFPLPLKVIRGIRLTAGGAAQAGQVLISYIEEIV